MESNGSFYWTILACSLRLPWRGSSLSQLRHPTSKEEPGRLIRPGSLCKRIIASDVDRREDDVANNEKAETA